MKAATDDELLHCAQSRFGLDYLFPYQRLVIAGLVESLRAEIGNTTRADAVVIGNQIVILPTGAGKSLCFQLPAALCGGTTVVIYPLLGLMNDQERRMQDAGFSVRQLRGGQSRQERHAIFAQIAEGSLDFLVTNPETLATEAVRSALSAHPPAHAVVDEAHCISEWGDTFRPAYVTLGDSLDAIGIPRRTAFTATASDRVITRIREVLFSQMGASVVRGNPDRPNISYSVVPTLSLPHALQAMLTTAETAGQPVDPSRVWHRGDYVARPALIFCRTRAETETIARQLRPLLPPGAAMYYHAGLPRDQKKAVEREFFERSDAVLAATCAYGLGIDKKNIRTVIHTYLPETAEAFLQESGRAGRDRDPAQSIVLVTPEEQMNHLQRSPEADPSPVQMMVFGNGCRRTALLQYFGVDKQACSGCDRCEQSSEGCGRTGHSSEHRSTMPVASHTTELILKVLAVDPVPRSATAWARVLTGRLSHTDHLAGLARHPATGVLNRWSPYHLADALDKLVELGLLRRRGARLIIPRQAAAVHTDLPLPFRPPQTAPDSSQRRRRRRWKDSREGKYRSALYAGDMRSASDPPCGSESTSVPRPQTVGADMLETR
ncbi:MAG: RecQ family ATP-dependent DNA helicase [Alkalispirochaeta sp.]